MAFPHAPNRGDRIRAFHMLREMSRFAEVSLFSLVHDEDEARTVGAIVQSRFMIPISVVSSTYAAKFADPDVVAIGETGLDYDRGFSSRDAQIANLRRHLMLAANLHKPAILHCRSKPGQRDAQDDERDDERQCGEPQEACAAAESEADECQADAESEGRGDRG